MTRTRADVKDSFTNGSACCDFSQVIDTDAMADHILAIEAKCAQLEKDASHIAAVLDRVQDNLHLMNLGGEISDAIYEKFYEVIPHSLWEQWHAARATTTEGA